MARKTDQIADLFASVGFRIDKASLKEMDTALGRVEKRLAGIVKAFQGMSGSKSLTGALRATAKDSGKAAAGIDTITSRLKAGIPALNLYTQQMRVLASELRSVSGARPALPRVPSGGVGGGRPSGGGIGTGGRPGFFAGMAGGLFGTSGAGLVRGMLPGIGAGWAIAHGTTRAREMIANEAALGALTGSQAAGRQEYNYIQDFSNKYGIRANESVGGYKRILASSVGTKLQGKGAKDIFEGVSLYGKALGLSDENMSRATTAISQMISKGKISSEELKGQLAEATPGAVQLFAKAITGGDVAKLFDMMEKGQVLAADVMPKVAEAFKEAALQGGALNKMMKSSASAQARFLNAWDGFLKKVFESGVDEGIAKLFDILSVSLEKLIPLVTGVGKAFRFAFVPIEGIQLLFKEMSPMLQMLTVGFVAFTAALFNWTKIMAAMAFLKANPLFIMLTLLFLLLEDLWVFSKGGKSLIGDLGDALANLISPEIWDGFFGFIDYWIEKFAAVYNWIVKIKDKVVSGPGGKMDDAAKDRANSVSRKIEAAQNKGQAPLKPGAYFPSASTGGGGNVTNAVQITIDGYGKDKLELAHEIERVLASQINTSFSEGLV